MGTAIELAVKQGWALELVPGALKGIAGWREFSPPFEVFE